MFLLTNLWNILLISKATEIEWWWWTAAKFASVKVKPSIFLVIIFENSVN
jgi:hypothetical protein